MHAFPVVYSDFSATPSLQKYQTIFGAALQGDIQAIRNSSALCVTDDTQFVVCGKDPFKQALVDIFTEEKLSNQITIFEPEAGFSASALGAYLVAEKCKII